MVAAAASMAVAEVVFTVVAAVVFMVVAAVMAEATGNLSSYPDYQRKAPEYTSFRVWDRIVKRGTFS